MMLNKSSLISKTFSYMNSLKNLFQRKAFTYSQFEGEISKISGLIDRNRLKKLQQEEDLLFINLHPKSKEHAILAENNLLGGVPMPWMNRLPGSFPIFFKEAKGSKIKDIDSIEYVDFCLGDTGAMTGHSAPFVTEALQQAASRGITTMMPSEDASWVANELSKRFKLKYWQLAMTATDANRFSLRYSRYITGKPKICVMDWCYHGTVDETLAVLDKNGNVIPRPGAVGPQVHPSVTTRIAVYNDLESLENVLKHGDVACVLMEPALTNIGIVLPEKGYLEGVRELTKKYDALLIMDETHTISVGPGGATKAWNLDPDMFVIGKPIGGGMPVAAYGLSEEVADKLKHHLSSDNIDVSGVGGTLTGNAMALAAIKATLSNTLSEKDFNFMIPLATKWTDGVQSVISEFKLPWTVQQLGCRSEYWFCPRPKNGAEAANANFHDIEKYFHLYCLNRGVLITPFHNMALLSPYHTINDVDKHTSIFRDVVRSMIC